MKEDKILLAIGNIDDDLIERAAPTDYRHREKEDIQLEDIQLEDIQLEDIQVRSIPWLRWFAPVAVCLAIAVAVTAPMLLKRPPTGSSSSGYMAGAGNDEAVTGSASGNSDEPSPSLSLDAEAGYAACYAAPEDWRGLPTENYVLGQQADDEIAADRVVFMTLDDLAAYADAFVIVPNVHKTAQDGDNMQTSIAEYAETIGDRLNTRKWDDRTVSTSNRILIRQWLIGGCTMDEPNNLLRKGGVYLLPVTFFPAWGAYEVVGDLDVLFELDDEGKIVSHSQWEGFNKYDGKSFSVLLEDVRALYPAVDIEFIEHPIDTAEQAEIQVVTAYKVSGFNKFSVEYHSEGVQKGAEVFLFKITFDYGSFEYAAIAKENGAFVRGDLKTDGDIQVSGGLGGFPW